VAGPVRIQYEGAFYHVTSRGSEGRKIWFGKADCEKFRSSSRGQERNTAVSLGISRDEVFQDRKDSRNMAIYLMKVRTGMTNRDIGNLFGAMRYSAVAKAYARFSTRLSEHKTLRKKFGHVNVSAPVSTLKG
jgi:hypothetical protein